MIVALGAAGVYEDVPAETYLADRALSFSGAKRLLPPSCPALFRWWADHPQPPKAEFDIGHAAHKLVLGVGDPVAVVDAPDWRGKYAREQRDKAREQGEVPLLAADWELVQAMAAALRAHPVAGALFTPGTGRAELTLVWDDDEFGVRRRARLDWLRPPSRSGGRAIIGDYKTTTSAEPAACGKTMADYGYHQQADWYRDAVAACGLAGDAEPAFVLVFQEKTPPYLVTVCEPDPYAVAAGRDRNRKALDIYARCVAAGTWPGYGGDVLPLPLPRWAERQHEAALERGDYHTEADPA